LWGVRGKEPLETIALYKEERIKVYGITRESDLILVVLSFPANQLELWGQRIDEISNRTERFELVTYHAANKSITELHLLINRKTSDSLSKMLTHWEKNTTQTGLKFNQPVDILYLHGPHFQDRYGIADTAFNALLHNDIEILVSGCAGTSMYLVTPTLQGQIALEILTKTFLIPVSS
jgi:aspartokinase